MHRKSCLQPSGIVGAADVTAIQLLGSISATILLKYLQSSSLKTIHFQEMFQSFTSFDVRSIRQKVKHLASALHSPNEEDVECGPGGRQYISPRYVLYSQLAGHALESNSKTLPLFKVVLEQQCRPRNTARDNGYGLSRDRHSSNR